MNFYLIPIIQFHLILTFIKTYKHISCTVISISTAFYFNLYQFHGETYNLKFAHISVTFHCVALGGLISKLR